MRKKILPFIVIVCILLLLTAAIILANRAAPKDKVMDILNRVENALGDEWKKQAVTEVLDLVYSVGDGNDIIYYVCFTTYYEAEPAQQTGLNTDAISAVIHPFEAESCRECAVSNLPAAIYQKGNHAYLCWTISPILSCVIEYDPRTVSEADIFRMAESVPTNTENIADP